MIGITASQGGCPEQSFAQGEGILEGRRVLCRSRNDFGTVIRDQTFSSSSIQINSSSARAEIIASGGRRIQAKIRGRGVGNAE